MEESLFCYVVYNESLTVNQVQGGIDIWTPTFPMINVVKLRRRKCY
jgi:hypothetical protein